MQSYSSHPCYSTPPLLLITALLLSSPSYHSFCHFLLATALLLSLSPQLSTAVLITSLPHISSPTHLFSSSPPLLSTALLGFLRFILAIALLLSSTASLPACFITCLPHHLTISSWHVSPSIESLSSWLSAMILNREMCFPCAAPPGPFPSSSSVNTPRSQAPPLLT